MQHDGSPEAVWHDGAGYSATLTHYGAAAAHLPHEHDHLQLSFVLAGSLDERLGRRDYTAAAGWRGCKPAGASHSDQWGPNGLLVFTLRMDSSGAAERACGGPGWRRCDAAMAAALVRAFTRAGCAAARNEALLDLLALDSAPPPPPAGPPPAWLGRARDALREAPQCFTIAALADEAGVHRGRFSAMFRRHFGVPPSIYRRRALAARAAARIVSGEGTIAGAAAEAGCYDQPHLNRLFRNEIGLTPGELRRLLAPRHISKNPA